jgi:hypothetical protein
MGRLSAPCAEDMRSSATALLISRVFSSLVMLLLVPTGVWGQFVCEAGVVTTGEETHSSPAISFFHAVRRQPSTWVGPPGGLPWPIARKQLESFLQSDLYSSSLRVGLVKGGARLSAS